MNQSQWDTLLSVVNGERLPKIPTGFIIDCPWLPGWDGVSTMDYFSDDTCWFEANKKAIETFPETTFLPGFWAEYGMCTEPSAFGAKCQWFEHEMPHADKVLSSFSEVDLLARPDVRTDGLLPFVINRLKRTQPKIEGMGHQIKFAVARGPLNIASFLMGTTELMMGMMTEQERCHKLVGLITDFLVDWIGYQIESFPSIEGILLLDDIVGFVGDAQCSEYVVPYFKKIYGAFDAKINMLHNDASGLVSSPYLERMGVNLFNPSFEHSLQELKELTGNKVAIFGNIPPRDVLAEGTPADVQAAVKDSVAGLGDLSRVILSCGGGMPQNVSNENIKAFIDAADVLS
ncbi:MAG: uroporphyrinogen decarboxylase [Planctomycetes bacterium]|nr:uroporphyrinogen decarboxylase [Planctomycetota bacterium]